MNLTHAVVAAIAAKGTGSLPDVAAQFPNHTREQVKQAIQNGVRSNYLWLVKRGKPLGFGIGKEPNVYALVDANWLDEVRVRRPSRKVETAIPRLRSVWDLGQGAPVIELAGKGEQHEPLGDW